METVLKVADMFVDSTVLELKATNEQLFRVVDDLKKVVNQRNEALQEMAESHFETMYFLALGAEFREGRDGLRLVRIGATAEILAKALAMPANYCSMIRRAAPLYDIGMTAIPDALFHKREDLTDEEWQTWRSHTQIGSSIMSSTFDNPLMRMAAEIALTHHENFQGNGYPEGLNGQDIPMSGRIVALAEYFESHSSPLGHQRQPMPQGVLLEYIRDLSGRRFDPELVELLCSNMPAISAAHSDINAKANSFQALAMNITPNVQPN